MRRRTKAAVGAMAAFVILGFVLLAPVVYIPAPPLSGCNYTCITSESPHYASLGQILVGFGACYWPPSNYYVPC